MRERYIPAFIMLLAATITSIINIANNVSLFTAMKRLLLVIVIFYVIGLIVKTVIVKAFTPEPKEEVSEEAEDIQDMDETQETAEEEKTQQAEKTKGTEKRKAKVEEDNNEAK